MHIGRETSCISLQNTLLHCGTPSLQQRVSTSSGQIVISRTHKHIPRRSVHHVTNLYHQKLCLSRKIPCLTGLTRRRGVVIVAQKVMMQMFLPTNSIQSDTFMQPFFVFVILLSDLAFLMGFG